jgi:hypothetical protein
VPWSSCSAASFRCCSTLLDRIRRHSLGGCQGFVVPQLSCSQALPWLLSTQSHSPVIVVTFRSFLRLFPPSYMLPSQPHIPTWQWSMRRLSPTCLMHACT